MDKEVPEEAFYEEMLPREAEDNYPLEEDTGLAEPCMLSADISLEDQLFFDNLYDRFTDMEKKIFMKSFLLLIRWAKR